MSYREIEILSKEINELIGQLKQATNGRRTKLLADLRESMEKLDSTMKKIKGKS